MNELFFWQMARVCGLASFAALSISLLTGVALRSAVLSWLASSRALRSTHEFTALLWIPLGAFHLLALVLDVNVSPRIRLVDLVVPFQVSFGLLGRVGIGMGTLTFEALTLVAITGWLRTRIPSAAWRWIHRLAYPAYLALFLHAVLSGSDFSTPLVSALTWGTATALSVLVLSRILWGRLPARG